MSTPPHAIEGELDLSSVPRKVLFIAGAGRSGTSTLAGISKILGLHVPEPEVAADDSNPKGFGEPQWCVDTHDAWLERVGVQVSDARPEAWNLTGRLAAREAARIRASTWLEQHFEVHPELVVKDPRLSWFLSLWRVASLRCAATPVFATMLRPPAEVVGSKQKYYANRLGSAHLAASWLNMLLHTERATRQSVVDGGRVFVRYGDLLDDWVRTVTHMGQALDLQTVIHAGFGPIREGHRFVDPSLRRVNVTLDELRLPPRLHELVGETWNELNKLAEPDGDTPEVHTTLDQLRDAYIELYEESEAIARSSAVAARVAATRPSGERVLAKDARQDVVDSTGAAAPAPATVPGERQRLADRVPHSVRASIPPSVRRGVRRALGRER